MSFSKDQAEVVAIKALGWMIQDDEVMGQFLGATGADTSDLAQSAKEPEFLASVIDFLMMDETNLMQFCDAEGLAYDIIMQVRAQLPGGDLPNWT